MLSYFCEMVNNYLKKQPKCKQALRAHRAERAEQAEQATQPNLAKQAKSLMPQCSVLN